MDGVREWKIVSNVIVIVVIGRDSNGESDGVFAGPRFEGRGFFGVRVDVDEHIDKFSGIINGEFDGGQMEKAATVMSDEDG